MAAAVSIAALALALWAGLDLAAGTAAQAPHIQSGASAALPENRDTQLYRAVIDRVSEGESYYAAAAQLHRERSYPLYPFFTVRPPTLAWISAAIGTVGLYVAAWLLLLGNLFVWLRALGEAALAERAVFLGLMALVGASSITPAAIALHEFWCGLLLSLALGLHRDEQWRVRLVCIAIALAIREFAAAFLAVVACSALLRKRWNEFVACALIGIAFAGLIALHYFQVTQVRIPDDLASPPWNGLRGPAALVEDLTRVTFLGLVPQWMAALVVFLPLCGWAFTRMRKEALLWFAGFAAVIAVAARPNNTYWVLVLLPVWLAGIAFAARILPAFREPGQRPANNREL